jgi:uncharacterized repeat protein (TIGR01451 family)/fimbrial isopeptide formation D2 family protein
LFAGLCLFAPIKKAEAVASLNLSSSFTSADSARSDAYMDAGGTWNGVTEVTNTSGDRFVLSIQNTAAGSPLNDTAFDLAISVDVAAGFRLPTSPSVVTVTESPACAVLAGVTATQPGAGGAITINLPANTDIAPGCRYDFDFGLTTDDVPPSVSAGTYAVDFNVNYNEVDNTASSNQSVGTSRNIDVRRGDVALLKTAVTALAGNGDTVQFTVSILGAGQGGVFDVVLTDALSPDLVNLNIIPPASPPAPPGASGPLSNQYTYEYIAPGQQVDLTITATVAVDPNALSCPNLTNTADVIERLGTTSSFFDSVPFDLQTPLLEYNPPDINIPFGVAGIDVTVPVQNIGTGVAKNISLSAANLAVYNINVLSPDWSYAAGVFTYSGTLAAGASTNLVFNISASSCPPPPDQNIDWIPAYQNACGTDFYPPLRFSSTTLTNVPNVDVNKSVSAAALNIGTPGSYTLALGGTNTANLPDGDFVVTDILPLGVTGVVINVIPATTQVEVNGVPYTAGDPIPDQATIVWRGDRADLAPLPTLQIDFIAGSSVPGFCPVGQTITNSADLLYANCAINNSSSAGFILNENPAGGAVTNIAVGGDGDFQAGARDSDGVIDSQTREGEHIPFTVSYSFPAGFNGVWAGTSYTAELRSVEGSGVPLVLTNNRNDVNVRISRISDGALICAADLNPGAGDFTGGDGTAPLVITDFGSLSVCALPANLADHDLVISYTATSPEGDLDVNNNPVNTDNIGGYLENTTLTVASGPLSCLNNSEFIQAANVNIERAELDISATFNNGNPVSVCSVVPVTMNLAGPAADTDADNVFLQFNDTSFEFVDAAGNLGNPATDLTYGGSLAALTLNAVRAGNDIQMTVVPNTDDVTADGSVTFNARLRDSMVPGTMDVRLDYDSNHSSPDGAPTDADRDFTITNVAAPFEILSGQLEMEFFPPDIILLDSTNYAFRAQITNVGTGDAVNAVYRMTLPLGMTFNTSTPLPTSVVGQTIEWDLGDLAPAQAFNIDIETVIDQSTCFTGAAEFITSENEWGCGSPIVNTVNGAPGIVLAPHQLTLSHDSTNSFCELCGEGEIRLLVTNTGSVLLTDVFVLEDLQASGLTYVPNSTTYLVDGVPGPAPLSEPTVSGGDGENILWTQAQIPELANLYSAFNVAADTPQEIEIRFRVRRNTAAGFSQEGLVAADRNIQASAAYGLFCGPPPQTSTSNIFEIPLEQPAPEIRLQGRNVDANQSSAQYTDNVYGGAQDDVIWRLTIANNSSEARADLQDLLVNQLYTFISESIAPPPDTAPNFNISWICKDEADATSAAAGAPPPDCIPPPGTPTSTSHDVDDPFGDVGAFIDTLEGGEINLYFVGQFQTLCNLTRARSDIEWGCENDIPPDLPGGIDSSYNGGINSIPLSVDETDIQISGSDVDAGDIAVTHSIAGTGSNPLLGSKGVLTITIANNANGSVRNVTLTDVLPTGYALDISQVDNPGVSNILLGSVVTTPRFGVYDGMVDTATVTNLNAVAFENNTSLDISLTSTTGAAPQNNLLRAGDVVVLTINIVKVAGFDIEADPDIEDETVANGQDPAVPPPPPQVNQLSVDIRNTCGETVGTINPGNLTVTPSPADLDITINRGDPNKTYVISNPTDTLSLDVEVANNGGHDANDHFITVIVGSGLRVTALPAGCALYANPPAVPRPVWDPVIPTSGATYICDAGSTIAPGDVRNYLFTVEKQNLGADLTFRADVVGEITLADGSPLVYPAPVTNVITNIANNYSLDTIRARIIGFNLTKTVTDCREQAPLPALSQAANVQIGEDCTYRLSAGWFGFAAPGFGQISIGNIAITDAVAAGQGFISQADSVTGAASGSVTAPTFSTTPGALVAPDEISQARWEYNNGANTIIDNVNIDIDIVKRTRNDAIDASAPPNNHGAVTTDTLNVSFEVDFDGAGGQAPVVFNNTSLNYPPITDRRVNVTVTEPNLTVTKEVCNETINGIGPLCTTFLPLVNDGDTNDDYVYRIRITNDVARAPAYDVDITDALDPTDLLTFADFATDGLDNDGDTSIDEADEALIVIPNNTPGDGPPAVVTISSANSTALQRIDPGATVELYYRVDPDDAAAPGQQLRNSATTRYDTLLGASGSQDAPQRPNSDIGGARVYTTLAQTAAIEITALAAPPDSKAVLRLSETPLGGAAPYFGQQDVVVGEEIEYQLKVDIPVSNLNNFVLRDELPAGIRCIEAQTINLDAGSYASAGFVPGSSIAGPFVPTCTDNLVEWNFGNQQLTAGPGFTFTATFIARVENSAITNDGDVIRNGGTGAGSTSATVSYTDAGGNPVVINLGPMDVAVREPEIVLDKSYAVANADADDVITVSVTATNTGSAPAHNLRVLDDLDAVANLTYIPGSHSANVAEDLTLGPNRPIFSVQPPAAIPALGGTFTFTFDIRSSAGVQPLEVLDNTVQASWTSLPDSNTALNSTGTIGADGTLMGMRNGALPNAGDLLNDYEDSFTNNNLSVPPVTITKNDLNPAAVPTIGERKSFQLVIALPEGVTNNLVISDDLFAAAGLPANASYVLENNAGFDIGYTFPGIATINGAAPDESVFLGFPADGAGGLITWNIGNVVTLTENDTVVNAVAPQIIINYFARINNDGITEENDALLNSASATYNNGETPGVATAGPVAVPQATVLEPLLVGTKTFTNVTPGKLATDLPDGGDILEYVVTLTNTGSSTAFDTNIVDTLPPELQLDPTFSPTATIGGAPILGFVATPAGAPAGPLIWGRDNGDETLDIPVGAAQQLVLTYRVVLEDTALADLTLNNNVLADWTSLDGVSAVERTGANCPAILAPNDYCTGPIIAVLNSSDNNTITKTRLSDTSPALTAANDARIGDIIDYELRISLQEGSSPAVVVSDVLPQGLAFEHVVSVNGDTAVPYAAVAPFNHADILATNVTVVGDPVAGSSTVRFALGDVVNTADNVAANDDYIIVYRARVLNLVHPQVNTINLTNTANLDYNTAVGAAVTETDTETVVVLQPDLSVSKTAAPQFGDTIIEANELIDYTVDITNNGTAPAYDTVLRDIIPLGLRNGGATITMISTELAVAGTPLTNLAPVYDPVSGIATWNFDTGVADQYSIPPGEILRIVYRVQAEPDIGAGLSMTNSAQVQLYYSFDDDDVPSAGTATGVREIYGPSNTATATVLTPAADPLAKQNPANLNASIGEPFTYRITIPAVPQTTALHDVRVLDNLAASTADLVFVSVTRVSGSQPWTPVNAGTPDNLIIQDSGTDGIDVPAGEVAVIDVTVQLRNQPVNVAGLMFNNTASYTFNQIDGDNTTIGVTAPVTTPDMTVVEPTDMTMEITGPAMMQFGTPEVFTMNVQNIGTGPAWDMTLTSVLPDATPGGMCDTPPNNFTAQVFQADGVTPVSPVLVEGIDYTTNFTGAPLCTLNVTMLSANARVDASNRLIVTYEATLDVDNLNASPLTTVAGATQWFSADTAGAGAVGEIRTYTRTLTDGTTAVVDHEDAHTVLTQSPILVILKTVENLSSGQSPGINAEPGDTLRYTVQIQNTGPVPIPDFSLTDEPDRLTTPPGIFVPGSMANITVPIGADTSNTNINGGANGAGLLDVRNLSLTEAGGGSDILTISFEITLQPVLTSGTLARNQAMIDVPNFSTLMSDDPNVNGLDDPLVFGDEDPTQTLIGSVPTFRLQKASQDLTNDPAVLQLGDTLRYTITAKNIGVENAINSLLRDHVPANTTYVANSTTLNGNPIADPAAGVSPLQDGILINAPEDLTPGNMRADPGTTTANVATITFDVVVATDVINGTVISNQGFMSGEGTGSGPFPTQPSDDPGTDVFGDPTQDVIGNLPILDVQKTAMLLTDGGVADQVDPGDTLRYSFVISNAGSIPSTGVVLTDNVPANTSYVANSVRLNGIAIADTVAGTSPLIAGVDISSADLTPPLPTPGNGTVNASRSATLTFDVVVTGASGQLISNQATLSSNELPFEPSDADGNDENGDQPTVIAIGSAQTVVITKEVQIVGGGVARAGGQLEYIIRAENVGSVPVSDIVITDDIDLPVAGQLSHVPGSARMNGSETGITLTGGLLTADFGANYGVLDPGTSVTVSFIVDIAPTLTVGTSIDNTANISWNAASQTAADSASVDIGSAPGIAALNGSVWHDLDFDDLLDDNELLLTNWAVEIYLNSQLLDIVYSDDNGDYNILGLTPSSVAGGEYEIRFTAPGASSNTAALGHADSRYSKVPFTDGLQRISNISVNAGGNSFNLNLPIDPNGIVYDSVLRIPVAGTTLTLINASKGNVLLPDSCFDDPAQQNQVTPADGYYKFNVNFSVPGVCDIGDSYVIQITPPASGYLGTTSAIIPPALALTEPAFSVPDCPGSSDDLITTTPDRCEIQDSAYAPPTSIEPRSTGTTYYLQFTLDNNANPYTQEIFNNHIPVDPELDAAVAISKTSSLLNVVRSQLVPYTIVISNTLAAPLRDLNIVDTFPAGFKYVAGSARVDDQAVEPAVNGLQLTWADLSLNTSESRTIKLLLVPGSGVGEGEYTNLAQVFNNRTAEPASEQASATVRIVPDPTFDCTDVIGKVFDDANLNGYQDEGEGGLPSAKVVTARGLEGTTDTHGRFHITCAVVPNRDRGSNFIIKLDERSLPSGYRVTTENPRVERATRGKMLKFNFGAAIHRVVRLDMADAVFEPNSTEIRPQWLARVSLLMEKLVEAPSILRLAYLADVEKRSLVNDRVDAVKKEIERRWADLDCCYKLEIETEIFWRRGKPADRGVFE